MAAAGKPHGCGIFGLYRGDKYNILGNVAKDLFLHGLEGEETRTKIELLTVKHTLPAAEKIKKKATAFRI